MPPFQEQPSLYSAETSISVLLTVPAKLLTKIISNEKRVEFRKVWPRTPVKRIWFCEKGSGGRVTVQADIEEIVVTAPEDAWHRYGRFSGVTEGEFFAYTGARTQLYCIVLKNAISVHKVIQDLNIHRPPQNFAYVK